MKKWSNPNIKELSISATANIPTTELAVDEYSTGKDGQGYFKQGYRDGSGSKSNITYYEK